MSHKIQKYSRVQMMKTLLAVVDEAGRVDYSVSVYSDSSSRDLFWKPVLFVCCFSFTSDALSVRASELQQFIIGAWPTKTGPFNLWLNAGIAAGLSNSPNCVQLLSSLSVYLVNLLEFI